MLNLFNRGRATTKPQAPPAAEAPVADVPAADVPAAPTTGAAAAPRVPLDVPAAKLTAPPVELTQTAPPSARSEAAEPLPAAPEPGQPAPGVAAPSPVLGFIDRAGPPHRLGGWARLRDGGTGLPITFQLDGHTVWTGRAETARADLTEAGHGPCSFDLRLPVTFSAQDLLNGRILVLAGQPPVKLGFTPELVTKLAEEAEKPAATSQATTRQVTTAHATASRPAAPAAKSPAAAADGPPALAQDATPAIGAIDRPFGYLPGAIFEVAGWIVGEALVTAVEVYVDGVKQENVTAGLPRPDVQRGHPNRPGSGESGFMARRCSTTATGGESEIIVLGRQQDGGTIFLRSRPSNNFAATDLTAELRATRTPRTWPTRLVSTAAYQMELGNLTEAELIGALAVARFPDDAEALLSYAQVEEFALGRGEGSAEEMLRRYRRASNIAPDRLGAVAGVLRGHLHLGEIGHAVFVARTALAHFPLSQALYALIGMDEGTTATAEDRMAAVSEAAIARDLKLAARAFDRPKQPQTDLAMRFESLGGDATFGLVQRALGHEPGGLLAFGGAPVRQLIAALDSRFQGVGHPAHTLLEPDPDSGDLWVRDPRFDLRLRSFLRPGGATAREEDLAQWHKEACERLARQARRLVAELERGHKIFVYQNAAGTTLDEMLDLHETLKRIGPARLLCVLPGTGSAPKLSVVAPGLVHATLPGFAATPDPTPGAPGWLPVLTQAAELADMPAVAAA
jgi:hypothetical protein